MKKKLKALGVLMVAVVAGYNVYASQGLNSVTNVALSEVEALADGEVGCVNGPNCWGYCFVNSGTYSCEDYWIWNCVTAIN